MRFRERCENLRACEDAMEWLGQRGLDRAWRECERGDWMLWWAGRTIGNQGSRRHRKLVLAACECARLALPRVASGETRPLEALETAEAWARRDGPSLADVRAAAYAAYAAAYAARVAILRQCADICRQQLPRAPRWRP